MDVLTGLVAFFKRLHASEQGAEGLEKLLIIAAIVLPLLGLLIFFRGEILGWVTGEWDRVRDDAADFDVGR
jgi:hypothetical protein